MGVNRRLKWLKRQSGFKQASHSGGSMCRFQWLYTSLDAHFRQWSLLCICVYWHSRKLGSVTAVNVKHYGSQLFSYMQNEFCFYGESLPIPRRFGDLLAECQDSGRLSVIPLLLSLIALPLFCCSAYVLRKKQEVYGLNPTRTQAEQNQAVDRPVGVRRRWQVSFLPLKQMLHFLRSLSHLHHFLEITDFLKSMCLLGRVGAEEHNECGGVEHQCWINNTLSIWAFNGPFIL